MAEERVVMTWARLQRRGVLGDDHLGLLLLYLPAAA